MRFNLVLPAAVLQLSAASAAASPTTAAASQTTAAASPTSGALTAKIKIIAPGSASCQPAQPDCRTADQATPFIFASMAKYGLTSPNEMAAVIALMAFESGDFRYKHNAFPPPGRPGQGTANMQSPAFNLLYAKSLDSVKEKVSNVTTTDGLAPQILDEILALVTVDAYNFGSGAWFLVTQCPATVRDALKADIDCGFKTYMACVGVEVTGPRKEYLARAKQAFGLS